MLIPFATPPSIVNALDALANQAASLCSEISKLRNQIATSNERQLKDANKVRGSSVEQLNRSVKSK